MHHRTLTVFMTASVLALAAGSTAAATAPAAHPSKKKATPCTLNKTFKIVAPTTPRVWTVKTNGTNLRSNPGTDCKIIKVLTKGTKLQGSGQNAVLIPKSTSKWIQVSGPGFTNRWIAATQVS